MTLVQDSGPEWLFCGDCQVSFCWERSYLYLSSVSWSEVGQCARRSRLEHRKVLTDSLSQISAPQERLYSTWIGYVLHSNTFCCGIGLGRRSPAALVIPTGAVCQRGCVVSAGQCLACS